MVNKLEKGMNPGKGNKPIGKGISEARGNEGGRVYWRKTKDGKGIEILGKSNKNNQNKVIKEVTKVFGG